MTNPNLPFTIEEFRTRLAAVRRNMEAAAVEVLVVTAPENIYYLTGYHTLGYFTLQMLIVPLERDPIILTRGLNATKARHSSWIEDIEGYTDTDDVNDKIYNVLADYGLGDKRIATQNNAWFLTIAQYEALASRLGTKPLDGSGLIEQVRQVKSLAEIAYIREAGRFCAASMDAATDAVRAGATENDVAAAMHFGLISAGSEYLGHPPLVTAGPAACFGMETYERRTIRKDEVLFLEAGGSYRRYNAALSRTVFVGEPDPKWIRMYEVCRDAFDRAAEAVKPGATSHDVHTAGDDYITAQGHTMGKRLGYAIGIGFPPDWGESRIRSINQGDETVLEPGMVFHLIPALHVANEGGVVFSEVVAVTETGCETLSPYHRDTIHK